MSDDYLIMEKILSEHFDLCGAIATESFIHQLASKINDLIQNDFTTLIHILYRIDVSESRLKETLNKYPEDDAGYIIANLMIQRQLQKLQTKRQSGNSKPLSDEEKW